VRPSRLRNGAADESLRRRFRLPARRSVRADAVRSPALRVVRALRRRTSKSPGFGRFR
jgi:hypothetical protein